MRYLALSVSVLILASCSDTSSSLIPTQFKASASAPVTSPVFAVSFAASIKDSMGRLSPNLPYTPAAISTHFATSSSLVASCAKSWAASVACPVSPRILKKPSYASSAISALNPAVSNAVLRRPIASRYSSVASSMSQIASAT